MVSCTVICVRGATVPTPHTVLYRLRLYMHMHMHMCMCMHMWSRDSRAEPERVFDTRCAVSSVV